MVKTKKIKTDYNHDVSRVKKIFGIDRTDNSTGYILENCIPCCDICNYMKNDLSKDKFIYKISKIYKKHLTNQTNSK